MPESSRTREGEAVSERVADALARKRFRHFSAVEFLVVLTLWIMSTSFLAQIRGGSLIEAVLASAVLVSAVLAVGGRRRTLGVAFVLVAPTFVCKWLNHCWPDLMPREVYTAGLFVVMVFVVAHYARFVQRARRVDAQVLCAGISIYLLLGLLWAITYMLLEEISPGSFVFTAGSDPPRPVAGFEAVNFSLGVLAGSAFSDLAPASKVARMLATAEVTVSLFYVAILIARLVSLYSSEAMSDDRGGNLKL